MSINGFVSVIIVAGGKGTRMGTEEYKQFLLIKNVPILAWTIFGFEKHNDVSEIILAVPGDSIDRCREEIVKGYGFKKVKEIVAGGETRQESVYNGLKRVGGDVVLVHDGVRPFVSERIISDVIKAAAEFRACAVGTAVTDTLKTVDTDMTIITTLDRGSVYSVQTPQGFGREVLLKAHENARSCGFTGTDDAALTENIGVPTKLVTGENMNIKITTKEDLFFAEYYANNRLMPIKYNNEKFFEN